MNRTEIINRLIDVYGYQSYLEIGVDNRALNYDHIRCKMKVGVDPKPIPGINAVTSDQFFYGNRKVYDIIFIDGLHHHEQVIKDINNALECLNENGTIVVHDCNPTTELMQVVPRIQGEWTGDVWKAWCYFRNRQDLSMHVLDTDYGVGIIRRGKQVAFNLIPENYKDFDFGRQQYLNLIPVDNEPISICIPAFEQYGYGAKTLTQLLESIQYQQGNFDVIIADNSEDRTVIDVVDMFKNDIDIKYYHNPVKGISQNTNFVISKASHSLIKLMYQDDFFLNDTAIHDIAFALKFDNWLACSGEAINDAGRHYRHTVPVWTNQVILGRNSIGMPSVTAFRENKCTFDSNLKTLLDCDYYHQLYTKWGKPGVIRKKLIGSRYWDGSTSRKQGNMTYNELPYIIKKYGITYINDFQKRQIDKAAAGVSK